MSTLPQYIVLKSKFNDKYLQLLDDQGSLYRYLQVSGGEVASLFTRFQVELSNTDEKLVHLKCYYNNKYMTLCHDAKGYAWILCNGNNPEVDRSKESCTLFEPIKVGDNDYRFRHVNTGNYAILIRQNEDRPTNACLTAPWPQPNQDLCDVFTVIDWSSLVILPKYITFKRTKDQTYLAAQQHGGILQFSESDDAVSSAAFEVFTTSDGNIRLKSTFNGKFWKRGPSLDWICADSDDATSDDPDTLFWPVKVGDNAIALRNVGNRKFCIPRTDGGRTDCLSAAEATIMKEARLEVNEIIISRTIFNITYRLEDARIYNHQAEAFGETSSLTTGDVPSKLSLKRSLKTTKSFTWKVSFSLKMGAKSSFKTGIPTIMEGKVEVSGELGISFEFGKTETKEDVWEASHEINLPAYHKGTIRAVAIKATCDVPYSYSQTDVFADGSQVTYRLRDGMFTGINAFRVDFEDEVTKL